MNKGPSVCVPVFLSLCLAELTSLNLGKTASHRYESLLLYLLTILLFCQNTLTPVRPLEAKRRRVEISVFPRRTLRQGKGSPLPGRTQNPWALRWCLSFPVWALSTVPHHPWPWVGSPVPWEGRGLGRAQTGVSLPQRWPQGTFNPLGWRWFLCGSNFASWGTFGKVWKHFRLPQLGVATGI